MIIFNCYFNSHIKKTLLNIILKFHNIDIMDMDMDMKRYITCGFFMSILMGKILVS